MIEKNVFKKSLVIGIIILFVGASVIPSISGNVKKQINPNNESLETDWWPMFRHDLSHSGYSTSDAPDTNNVLWYYFTGSRVQSSPAVVDGKVYFGSREFGHKVYCLDAINGNEIWNYTTGDWITSSPAVADDKVYIGSFDAKMYCLDANNGDEIWNYTTGGWVRSSPAVVDGKVYFGSGDKKVYCLDANIGNEIWIRETLSYVYSSPAVADGKVFIGEGFYGNVYCLDADNGDKIWNYTTGGQVESSPAVADGKVYIGSLDNKTYCLDANNGNEIWNYTTGFSVYSSPAVADGKVYIGSYDTKIYCLDANNGNEIWNCFTGSVISSPAVVDGRVYIGSVQNGYVYCFADPGGDVNIEIEINGGFRVSAEIKNIGTVTATDVEWSIDLSGGLIFLGRRTTGEIPELAPDETKTVRQPILFGIGKDVVITVTADDSSKQAVAKWVLGPLVLGVT